MIQIYIACNLLDKLFGNKSSNGASNKLYNAWRDRGPCHCGREKPRRERVEP